MVFQTEPHIERARRHLAAGDPHCLRYACLELRFALERIAYQKLQLRLGEISPAEVAGWQPARVVSVLMELVDPMLNVDAELSIGADPARAPADDSYTRVGMNKGVDAKKLGKHWHKLGSYLHMKLPTEKDARPVEPDPAELRAFIAEVIAYVDETTSTSFDMYIAHKLSFPCGICGQVIVRNSRALKPGIVVDCQNPNCDASYTMHPSGDGYRYAPHVIPVDCAACGKNIRIHAKQLLSLRYNQFANIVCVCGAAFHFRWVYKVTPAKARVEGDDSPTGS